MNPLEPQPKSLGDPCADADRELPTAQVPGSMARLLMGLVRGYQLGLSGFLPPRCRYVPSCSAYALEALRVHGAARGSWLACRRICRCHPWGGHGFDPVPPATAKDALQTSVNLND